MLDNHYSNLLYSMEPDNGTAIVEQSIDSFGSKLTRALGVNGLGNLTISAIQLMFNPHAYTTHAYDIVNGIEQSGILLGLTLLGTALASPILYKIGSSSKRESIRNLKYGISTSLLSMPLMIYLVAQEEPIVLTVLVGLAVGLTNTITGTSVYKGIKGLYSKLK